MRPAVRPRSLWASFRDAFAGLGYVLRTQRNARVHLVVGLAVVAVGLAFQRTNVALSRAEWLVLVVVIGLVFAAECFNTAVEALVDLLSPDWHERAKVAKDTAAATVLCGAIAAVVVGLIVFLPRLARLSGLVVG